MIKQSFSTNCLIVRGLRYYHRVRDRDFHTYFSILMHIWFCVHIHLEIAPHIKLFEKVINKNQFGNFYMVRANKEV